MDSRLALALFLLVSSCRSAAEPGAPARRSAPSPARPDLEIEIELATSPALAVRVRTRASAGDDGTTTFRIDDRWGGVDDASTQILEPSFTGADGRSLPAEQPSANEWRIHAAPGERVEAAWHVAPNGFQADPDPRVHYHTLLDAELFHAIGHLAFLVPEHLDGNVKRRIAVRWKGFAESSWTVASSLGCDPRGFEGEATVQEMLHAVYLAGPKVRVIEVPVRGRPVRVAIAGDSWTFADAEFVEMVRAIVDAERSFFSDDAFPSYLVSLIPVGKADPRSRSLGGTGLTRSFALFVQPNTPLGAGNGGGLDVPHLLAHEMFHHWDGGVATMGEPEELVYWFSEGFTDFFARRILRRAGFGGLSEFARSLNETLKEYAFSPVREAPAERIREEFWKNRDVGRLPYLRGNLVAAFLDLEIRERSRGARSLDDFMREVVAAGRTGEKLDNDSLVHRIAAWTSPEFAQRVRAIVVDGAPVELDPSTFGSCLELRKESLAAYDLGFDLEASRAAKTIRGVRSGSAAEKAGLADGQAFARLSISYGDPDKPVEIGVRQGASERTITWLPRGEAVSVPQVHVLDGAVEAECPGL